MDQFCKSGLGQAAKTSGGDLCCKDFPGLNPSDKLFCLIQNPFNAEVRSNENRRETLNLTLVVPGPKYGLFRSSRLFGGGDGAHYYTVLLASTTQLRRLRSKTKVRRRKTRASANWTGSICLVWSCRTNYRNAIGGKGWAGCCYIPQIHPNVSKHLSGYERYWSRNPHTCQRNWNPQIEARSSRIKHVFPIYDAAICLHTLFPVGACCLRVFDRRCHLLLSLAELYGHHKITEAVF